MWRLIARRILKQSASILRDELDEAIETGEWPLLERRIERHEDKAGEAYNLSQILKGSTLRQHKRRYRRALRQVKRHRNAAKDIAALIRWFSR